MAHFRTTLVAMAFAAQLQEVFLSQYCCATRSGLCHGTRKLSASQMSPQLLRGDRLT
jgi:hypothetical protein